MSMFNSDAVDSISMDKIKSHWDAQAKTYLDSPKATFNDIFLMEKEIRLLAKFIYDGMRVLDCGCGNGYTSLSLAKRKNAQFIGIDFSEAMINIAQKMCDNENGRLKGQVRYHVHDLLMPLQHLGTFDVIICKRVLINLVNWENQRQGLDHLYQVLKPHGTLLLSEANEDAWRRLNVLRRRFGLDGLGKPWYNRYVRNDELGYFIKDNFSLCKEISFSSTYYFGSRILQPFLLKLFQPDKEPSFSSKINQVFSYLPAFGDIGIQKVWVLRKK
jgi:2-polyprenyl-3-methyl-5-hydroxy-6-metoxy-1,4-benzoquinol methylase